MKRTATDAGQSSGNPMQCNAPQVTASAGRTRENGDAQDGRVRPRAPLIKTLPQQLTLRNSFGETAYDIAKATGDAGIIALFDEAMKELPSSSPSSSSAGESSASAGSSLSSLTAAQQGPGEAPVPMTPYPEAPMAENDEFDLTAYGADPF